MNLVARKKELEEKIRALKEQVNQVESTKQNLLMEALRLEGQISFINELLESKATEE